MVKASHLYLFIGEDNLSKDIKLKKLKEEYLHPKAQDFNFDILYARELTLLDLQEKILYFPLKVKKRIVIIKDAQRLKPDIKDFLLKGLSKPNPKLILVLDIDRYNPKDEFIRRIIRYAEVFRFRESAHLDTFTLSRQIELGKAAYAIRILKELLQNGEKPERILGGLRYDWERNVANSSEIRKRLKALLNCDLDIKTGRLKPDFALEKLVVRLCCFG